MVEASKTGKSREILPTGTALQKAQELWQGLNVEAKFFDLMRKEGKTVELDNGSWIRIAIGTDLGYNNFVTIDIVDNKENIGFICTISSYGKSSFQLGFGSTRISVDDSTFISNIHEIHIKPEAKYEEQVMLAFVDWARTSIDEGRVTEPPYKLENIPAQIKNPRAPASQAT